LKLLPNLQIRPSAPSNYKAAIVTSAAFFLLYPCISENRDVARKLIEVQAERSGKVNLSTIDDSFDYPLIVNAQQL